MTKKELLIEFDKNLIIARQLTIFGDGPTKEERMAAEERLKVIADEVNRRRK